jgi:hypothetical protein
MPKIDLTDEEVSFIKALRERARKDKKHNKNAYISGSWAFIPDITIPGLYRRVRTAVALYSCPACKAKPGEFCHSNWGPTALGHADRGVRGSSVEKRIRTASQLTLNHCFDRVEMCSVTAIFNAPKARK